MTSQKTIDRIVVALFFPAALAGTLAGDYVARNLDCATAWVQGVECPVYRKEAQQSYRSDSFRRYGLVSGEDSKQR
ncbi:MAG TPA: hypothetical protein VJI32_01265 [Candidatus Nanoarchaeia archaeon]|nr:hypothetical protein [Candidatus Nanoarchaeia archaeon]